MNRDTLLNVYQSQLPHMRRLARQYLGFSSPDVEDVLQDVFLKAWLHCDTLRDDDRCAWWLMRMTANACVSFLRHAKRSILLNTLPKDDTEDVYTRMIARLTLENALSRLTPSARQVVRLHTIEGYPLREVARRLSKPENTIKTAMRRARTVMRSA